MTRGEGAGKMTGSDSDEAGSVSRADFATFKQDIGNEIAQLQLAVQRSINDLVDGGGAVGAGPGQLGPQSNSSTAGVHRPGHDVAGSSAGGSSIAALLGQPLGGTIAPPNLGVAGQPVGGGSLGQPFGLPVAGAASSILGIAAQPVGGVLGAYAGPPGLPYPGQAGGLAVGPGGGFGYGAAGALGSAPAPGVSAVARRLLIARRPPTGWAPPRSARLPTATAALATRSARLDGT